VAVAQRKARQRAVGDVTRLATGRGGLAVAAVVEGPVAVELRAGRFAGQAGLDSGPACLAMALHVIVSDAIGDALIAQGLHQPVEDTGGVAPFNGRGNTVPAAASTPSKKFRIACQTADAMQQSDGVIAIGARELLVQSR
jgi:hypothetical protein